jgi:hypothetical protein
LKRISLFITILSLLALFASCGTQKPHPSPLDDSLTVDWTKVDQKPVPEIKDEPIAQVGPLPLNDLGSFGPGKSNVKQEVNDVPRALVLGPGGYRVLGQIALLKEMKVKNFRPQVVIGHGLASIVAAYYAFGYAPDYIEWKFFKFINALDDEKPFSKEWLRLVERNLLDELQEKNIEEGKLTLIVPVRNRKSGRINYLRRGALKPALLANLDHKGFVSKKYEPAFTVALFNRGNLRKIGIGEVYLVDMVTDGITWEKGSGFLNGIFEKAATVTLKSKAKTDIMMTYRFSAFGLDEKKKIADLVYSSKGQAIDHFKKIDERLKSAKDQSKE